MQNFVMCTTKTLIRPQDYKTFFMLNSAAHEIFPANKYENANNSSQWKGDKERFCKS